MPSPAERTHLNLALQLDPGAHVLKRLIEKQVASVSLDGFDVSFSYILFPMISLEPRCREALHHTQVERNLIFDACRLRFALPRGKRRWIGDWERSVLFVFLNIMFYDYLLDFDFLLF